jgi:catechol-2,3-dioxygenase
LPPLTNHFSFNVDSQAELENRRQNWLDEGLDVFEIDHNWCHSIYTSDPDGNAIEFCNTTGTFSRQDREQALAALELAEFKPSPEPAMMKLWKAAKPQ